MEIGRSWQEMRSFLKRSELYVFDATEHTHWEWSTKSPQRRAKSGLRVVHRIFLSNTNLSVLNKIQRKCSLTDSPRDPVSTDYYIQTTESPLAIFALDNCSDGLYCVSFTGFVRRARNVLLNYLEVQAVESRISRRALGTVPVRISAMAWVVQRESTTTHQLETRRQGDETSCPNP
jgi:hypothetical protein